MSQRPPVKFPTITDYNTYTQEFIIDGLYQTFNKAEILRQLGINQDIIDGLKESERSLGLMPLLDLCKKKQSKLGKVLYK